MFSSQCSAHNRQTIPIYGKKVKKQTYKILSLNMCHDWGYELAIQKLLYIYTGMGQMDSECWEPAFPLLERKVTDKQEGKPE